MARREISESEERQLIAAAEAARDAGTVGVRADVKVAGDASAVLSVRLPIDQLRALRVVAAERRESISALLQDAVSQLLTRPEPSVSVTEQLRRFSATGVVITGCEYAASRNVRVVTSPDLQPKTGCLPATLG